MKAQLARQTTEAMINEKDEREKEENGYTKVDQLGDKIENFVLNMQKTSRLPFVCHRHPEPIFVLF